MPVMTLPALTPYLATAGIGWLYYRRIRRSFGRQPWQPKRTIARLVLVSLVMLALVAAAVFLPHVGPGITLGAVTGAVLGVFALRHTRDEIVEGKRYYTPNPWIGGGLTLLLLGRLAWRWSQGGFANGAQMGSQASPLTMGIAATLIAYAVVYSSGLHIRMGSRSNPVPSTTL